MEVGGGDGNRTPAKGGRRKTTLVLPKIELVTIKEHITFSVLRIGSHIVAE